MTFTEIKEQSIALDQIQQAQLKGGTASTDAIIIEDINGF